MQFLFIPNNLLESLGRRTNQTINGVNSWNSCSNFWLSAVSTFPGTENQAQVPRQNFCFSSKIFEHHGCGKSRPTYRSIQVSDAVLFRTYYGSGSDLLTSYGSGSGLHGEKLQFLRFRFRFHNTVQNFNNCNPSWSEFKPHTGISL